ncbi:hypothetical protein [Candidatus Symbiobacter mobilis]|uniref:Uncharacterized protein n=1 Tax=Candidatus Symbiobacter mobilis CR TaxID=946483 RepID=U5N9W9_9BURK|nr:hypothetical protein [Candidatus Symbiobacter mobilis]AGX86984.1 hypothetical protein Cenrod_0881 [Candidatus Symbiobacter mobilis CR]
MNEAIDNPIAAFHPFSLILEPERVLQCMEESEQLRSLRRHLWRPLDKPLIGRAGTVLARLAEIDAEIDAQELDDAEFCDNDFPLH